MRRPITVTTINSYGRQAASFIRTAAAIGWRVRAQMRDRKGLVAAELADLPNVHIIEGDLENADVVNRLFVDEDGHPVDAAFINTTHWGDEVVIGCALADAALRAGVKHYVYSSMPDHARTGWESLPFWSSKALVEDHIRKIGLPATFVYAGIYNNNFTSLDYPLFRMRVTEDGSFEWAAPFAEDHVLPWLDAEHDVGPAVLQIFKDGYPKWAGARIPLAFELLTPVQVCESFSRGLQRPVRYVRSGITVRCPTPDGYPDHLVILERVLGQGGAPYFGADIEPDSPALSLQLWEGFRSVEEYAREVFPLEESNNGQTWMNVPDDEDVDDIDIDGQDDDDDGSSNTEEYDDGMGPPPLDGDDGDDYFVDDELNMDQKRDTIASGTGPSPYSSLSADPKAGGNHPLLPARTGPLEFTSAAMTADVLAHKLADAFPTSCFRQSQTADL